MRWEYEVEDLYNFNDFLEEWSKIFTPFASIGSPFTSDNVSWNMKLLNMLVEDDGDWENSYNWTFVNTASGEDVIKEQAINILNKVFLRYETHICMIVDRNTTIRSECVKFFKKLLKILDYTYERYTILLDLYDSQKSHLMDKLQSSRSGSRSLASDQSNSNTQNSTSLYNDAPQTSDVIATISGNQYATDLTKGQVSDSGETHSTGSDSFSESESHDTMTIMAKLDEIEKQFSNIWKKWLNEFDELFIEEVNY